MLKLRLSRGGTKKRPVYKVVVADSRFARDGSCLLYTSPSPRDRTRSRMPSSA